MKRSILLASIATLIALTGLIVALVTVVGVGTQPAGATFPGTNGKIAFTSKQAPGGLDIYTMADDGSALTRLTDDGATGSALTPGWSADGKNLAFLSNREGTFEIYVMSADGSGRMRLTQGGADFRPSWSPDGEKIAFSSNRDPFTNGDIYVINVDGSGLTRLTNDPSAELHPDWSPDGSKIAFSKLGALGITIMNPDGTGVEGIPNSPLQAQWPSWSPDGQKIAFILWDAGSDAFDIYVIDRNGENLTRLTQGSGSNMEPAWAPDGTKIAFTSKRDGNLEIYVMNADGSQQTRLTFNPFPDRYPAWQPLPAAVGPDTLGPLVIDASASPNPTGGADQVTITATLSDVGRGDSNIASAEFGGLFGAGLLQPVDGAFDEPIEIVSGTIDVSFLTTGIWLIFIVGTDSAGNISDPSSVELRVLFAKYGALGDSIPDGKRDLFGRADGYPLIYLNTYLRPQIDESFSIIEAYKSGWSTSRLIKFGAVDKVISGIGQEPGIVTITIGANDYLKACGGGFWCLAESKIRRKCIEKPSCHSRIDSVDSPFRNNLRSILSRLKAETQAQIFITNYYLGDSENPDAVHLITEHLNPIIEQEAKLAGGRITLVDVFSAFQGHTCHPTDEQWVSRFCFHPNAIGQQEIANLIHEASRPHLEP